MQSKTYFYLTICKELQSGRSKFSVIWSRAVPASGFMQQCEKSLLVNKNVNVQQPAGGSDDSD